jgi:hypothetical protein
LLLVVKVLVELLVVFEINLRLFGVDKAI